MGFSSAVIVSFLFFYIFHASASVIPDRKTVESKDSGEFKVHIIERGTKYIEKIKIDEENGVEYFHVPAHNGRTETDFLYDFKTKMTVSRMKSEGKCYLRPLPDNLPKPADLKTGLQMVSHKPPSQHDFIVRKYWAVSDQIDKTRLRQEVQDFCGQFPVFRLREVDLTLSDRDVGRTRLARDVPLDKLTGVPFCKDKPLPTLDPKTNKPACKPKDFIFHLKFRNESCAWYITCRFDIRSKQLRCEDFEHRFDSMLCYAVSCPT